MSKSRLAKKFATNKAAESQGIFYEEVDLEGEPLFRVRLARLNGQKSEYAKKLNQLMKPYRHMKLDNIPDKIRDNIFLKAFCETCIIAGTWQTWSVEEDKYVDGIEDLNTGNLLPATPENYMKVLENLGELRERLLTESMNFDNYRLETEAESKN